jgi:Zn finger protein HypA/HybF involved in hydrogenase expression
MCNFKMVKPMHFRLPYFMYCSDCDMFAMEVEDGKILCPKCHNGADLSVFVWDQNSRYPI